MHALYVLSAVTFVAGAVLLAFALAGLTFGVAAQMILATGLVLLLVAAAVAWLVYAGLKAQLNRVKTGKEALIGAEGIATTDLSPKGEVRVMGEFWQAKTQNAPIVNGETIHVVDLDGMVLIVKPVKDKA